MARLIPLAAIAILLASTLSSQEARPVAVRDTAHRTSIAADYEYASFRGDIKAWQFASVSLGERMTWGSLIGRVNYANRFSTSGNQFEADAYPHLGTGRYAYLNIGYSQDALFPRWRSGAELYQSLPNAYEASLGYRQLRFEGLTPVTLFTGSVGKYTGNYWISLRPYLRDKQDGLSASANLTLRRYYETANHYIGARVGYGLTPTDELTLTELARTNDFSADVHGSTPLAERLFGTWTLGYEREQLPQRSVRTRLDVTIGLRYDF